MLCERCARKEEKVSVFILVFLAFKVLRFDVCGLGFRV